VTDFPKLLQTLVKHDVEFINLQALIQTKGAAGRPKDMEAIAELEAILEERHGT
jgi:hypothetical protein